MLGELLGPCITNISNCACTGLGILERLAACCTSAASLFRSAETAPGTHTDELAAAVPALKKFDPKSIPDEWQDTIAEALAEVKALCLELEWRSEEVSELKEEVLSKMRLMVKKYPRPIQLAFFRHLKDDILPRFVIAPEGSDGERGRRIVAGGIFNEALNQLENTAYMQLIGDLLNAKLKEINDKIMNYRYIRCLGPWDGTAKYFSPKSMVVDYIIKIASKYEPDAKDLAIFEIIAFGLTAVKIDGGLGCGMRLEEFLEKQATGKWKELVALIKRALSRLPAEERFLRRLPLDQFISNGEQDNIYHQELEKKIREFSRTRGRNTALAGAAILIGTLGGLYATKERSRTVPGPGPDPVYPIEVNWKTNAAYLGENGGFYYYNVTGEWRANTTEALAGTFGYQLTPLVWQCQGRAAPPCQSWFNGTNNGIFDAIVYTAIPGPNANFTVSPYLISGDSRSVIMNPVTVNRALPFPRSLMYKPTEESKEKSSGLLLVKLERKRPLTRGSHATTPFHDTVTIEAPAEAVAATPVSTDLKI